LPAKPHGTAKRPVFSEHRPEQYNRMAAWVLGLDISDQAAVPEMIAGRNLPKSAEGELAEEASSVPRLLPREALNARPLAAKKYGGRPAAVRDAGWDGIQPASYQEPPAEFLQSSPSVPAGELKADKKALPGDIPARQAAGEKVKRGAPLPKEESKDPFDPEKFNRRYHKSAPPKGEETQPAQPREESPDGG
jgi:hypothetical protein